MTGHAASVALLGGLLVAAGCSGPKTGEPASTEPASGEPEATREAPAGEGVDLERPDESTGGATLERPDEQAASADRELTAPEPTSADPHEVFGASYRVAEGPRLDGMFVELTARHGGGCEDHTFTLKPGPRDAEQPTVQPVFVHHDPHGDRCRAMVSTEVRLPLEPVLGADCTERVELRAWPVDDAKHQWVLAMEHPMGCD